MAVLTAAARWAIQPTFRKTSTNSFNSSIHICNPVLLDKDNVGGDAGNQRFNAAHGVAVEGDSYWARSVLLVGMARASEVSPGGVARRRSRGPGGVSG